MRQNYTLGTTFSVCSAGNNLALIIILFVENVLSQCRRYSVVLFSEMKIYQIYVIRDERQIPEIDWMGTDGWEGEFVGGEPGCRCEGSAGVAVEPQVIIVPC